MKYVQWLVISLLSVCLLGCATSYPVGKQGGSDALRAGIGALSQDAAEDNAGAGIGAVAETIVPHDWSPLIEAIQQADKSGGVMSKSMPDNTLMVVLPDTLVFGAQTNNEQLSDACYPVLDVLTEALKQNATLRIKVVGHMDNSGDAIGGQSISSNRADAVEEYITTHGVATSRLTSEGRGVNDPIATNDTEQGQEKNRRIEVFVYAAQ